MGRMLAEQRAQAEENQRPMQQSEADNETLRKARQLHLEEEHRHATPRRRERRHASNCVRRIGWERKRKLKLLKKPDDLKRKGKMGEGGRRDWWLRGLPLFRDKGIRDGEEKHEMIASRSSRGEIVSLMVSDGLTKQDSTSCVGRLLHTQNRASRKSSIHEATGYSPCLRPHHSCSRIIHPKKATNSSRAVSKSIMCSEAIR
jgi:hypothetical protein